MEEEEEEVVVVVVVNDCKSYKYIYSTMVVCMRGERGESLFLDVWNVPDVKILNQLSSCLIYKNLIEGPDFISISFFFFWGEKKKKINFY